MTRMTCRGRRGGREGGISERPLVEAVGPWRGGGFSPLLCCVGCGWRGLSGGGSSWLRGRLLGELTAIVVLVVLLIKDVDCFVVEEQHAYLLVAFRENRQAKITSIASTSHPVEESISAME